MANTEKSIIQSYPREDIDLLARNLNEALRQLSGRVLKLEGKRGEVNLFAPLNIQSDIPTTLDVINSAGTVGSLGATSSIPRAFVLAGGARQEADNQWVSTDTGAVIIALCSDGKLRIYADTGLKVGQAYTPTLVQTLP